MSHLSIDPRTYQRLQKFAKRAGVSIHAAATDAIDNWLDISSDPRLAITALSTIALSQPMSQSDPLPNHAAPVALPPNVTCINTNLGLPPRPQPASLRKLHAASAGPSKGVAR